MLRRHFLAGLGVLCAAPALAQGQPRRAAPPAPLALTEADKADLARVERYLAEITTVRAGFLQVTSTGETARGTFLLHRGRGLRVEYDPPSPVLLIGTRNFLIYIDRELDQVSHLDIDSTPIAFLLRTQPDLTRDLDVVAVDRGPGALRLGLVRRAEPEAGRIDLTFSDRPLALRQWLLTDGRGVQTRVGLLDPVFGGPLDEALFQYHRKEDRQER
ncbi:MAG: outer membrane lipoprotein carrier protein LolA [Thalassobaculales bacterium]